MSVPRTSCRRIAEKCFRCKRRAAKVLAATCVDGRELRVFCSDVCLAKEAMQPFSDNEIVWDFQLGLWRS